MAPNIPLGAIFVDSEETSHEVFFEIQPKVPDTVPEVPKLFRPHLEQNFQEPDSPNLHQLTFRPTRPQPPPIGSLRPNNPRPALEEAAGIDLRTRNNNRRRNFGHHPAVDSQQSPSIMQGTLLPRLVPTLSRSPSIPPTLSSSPSIPPTRSSNPSIPPTRSSNPSIPPTRSSNPSIPPTRSSNPSIPPTRSSNPFIPPTLSGSASSDRKVPREPSSILQVPATQIPGRVPPSGTRHSTKDIPSLESSATTTQRVVSSSTRSPPSLETAPQSTTTSTSTTSTSTTSTTHSHLDLGVLKIPGHEPEAPADLVLIHHDRAIDTRNQTGLGGIFVRDDSTSLTPEGATALILIGLCSVFLVFICFIMLVQKIRRQKIESKIVQDDGDKPRYDGTGYTTYHQNPLSFLPPDILHALMHPISASKAEEVYEEPKPAFLTMEPPQPGNQIGRLWFSVYYDYMKSTLVLHILHARYVKGRGSTTNPGTVWVEACVLTPMNTIKVSNMTDTRRASLAPVFNQSFKFQVGGEEVTQFLLRLTLYDKHPQNGEKAVGSVIVPLNTVDLCSTETISRDLQ